MILDPIEVPINTDGLDEAQAKADKLLISIQKIQEAQAQICFVAAPGLENVLKEFQQANESLKELLRINQAHCSLAAQVLSQ